MRPRHHGCTWSVETDVQIESICASFFSYLMKTLPTIHRAKIQLHTPEYKAKSKQSVTASASTLVPQRPTTCVEKEPRITFRDTGAAGQSIFGQVLSWKCKPLPPLPHERTNQSASKKGLSKLKEHDCDTVRALRHSGADAETDTQQGKTAKAAKNFPKNFTSTAPKK